MIIGTRASKLALAQVDLVVDALGSVAPGLKVEVRKVRTLGDQVRDRPLQSLGGVGAFTKELDRLVLREEIDVAVNSLKDIPVTLTPGTIIAAVLPRGPSEDVLVSEQSLDKLPPGSTVGTSSVHRAAMVRRLRPDLEVRDLRGNVPTRLKKLRDGQYDAIILAKAGLQRLGIDARSHLLAPDVFVPSAGQGAVAVVCREDSGHLDVLRRLDHPPSRTEVEAERNVLARLGGGCYVPIGVHAVLGTGGLLLRANIMDGDGSRFARLERVVPPGDEGAQRAFADDLIGLREGNAARMDGRGEVFLVGAGPGDADLITVKGRELIRGAEVIVHDSLVNDSLLREAPPGAELIDVGKRGGKHKAEQEDINGILVEKAMLGKRVVRLKGGDPFLFGRGGEEAEALRGRGVRVHVVPGVTSAIAAPALAGIPVTHRGVSSHVTLATGHEGVEKKKEEVDWRALAAVIKAGGTLVILMGVSNLSRNAERLLAEGLDWKTPIAIVENGSMPGQRTVMCTLGNAGEVCEGQKICSPAVIVVGDVVRLRESLGELT